MKGGRAKKRAMRIRVIRITRACERNHVVHIGTDSELGQILRSRPNQPSPVVIVITKLGDPIYGVSGLALAS